MPAPSSHPLPSEHPTSPQALVKEDRWVELTHQGTPGRMTRPWAHAAAEPAVGLFRAAGRRHRHGQARAAWGKARRMKALGGKSGCRGAVTWGPCSSGQVFHSLLGSGFEGCVGALQHTPLSCVLIAFWSCANAASLGHAQTV